MNITTKDEWWDCFKQSKDHIKSMISYLYQLNDYWDGFPEGITFADLDKMDSNKDWKLLSKVLARIWFAFPEKECRATPGWFNLCDLCSEVWVFDDGEIQW